MSEMFNVDKDMNVTISPEMRLIPEFKELIIRDKGSPGDADGRKKLIAMKELAYIWHTCKHNGPYSNFSDKEKHLRLARDCFGSEEWVPDEKVTAALDRWRDSQQTVSMKILASLKTSLYSTYELVNIIHGSLQKRIEKKEYEGVVTDKKGTPISGLKVITEELMALLDIATGIPKIIDSIETLEEKIKKEESGKSARNKGNIVVSPRAE